MGHPSIAHKSMCGKETEFIKCSHIPSKENAVYSNDDNGKKDNTHNHINKQTQTNQLTYSKRSLKPLPPYAFPLPIVSPPSMDKHTSILKPGSKFQGYQESSGQRYQVEVKLTEVDLNSSTISGFLEIHNLIETNPVITTFFEGEIIGPNYSFETKHSDWGSTWKNDIQHWARFPHWRKLNLDVSNDSANDEFYRIHASNNDHLFMRWKELFLYPNADITDIKGASFAGFYYLCFSQLSGNITGLYYHKTSYKFQQLTLTFVDDSGISQSYEYA